MNRASILRCLHIVFVASFVIHAGSMSAPMAIAQFKSVNATNADDSPLNPTDAGQQIVAPSKLIEISNEPKSVDPVKFLPAEVTAQLTVTFLNQSLRDVFRWIRTERSLDVLVDQRALAAEEILIGELITERLNDAPLYLLLDRLRPMGIDWYFEDKAIHITTRTEADKRMTTIPYNLGDLLDAGYKPDPLLHTIMLTSNGHWSNHDGDGGAAVFLGDVLFVRQTQASHLEISGLLSALRQHGRRTFILEPPQHELLRQKLNQPISVDFDEIPLNTAVEHLSELSGIDLRIDSNALSQEEIPDRLPISVKSDVRPLSFVLQAALLDSQLTWIIESNVLWITTLTEQDKQWKTAVFDVRDLCRNGKESNGLMNALHTQTGGKWENIDGEGGMMICPLPGVLVVRNNERILDDVLKLLEGYRTALRSSKPRPKEEANPKEILTRYYRLQKEVAIDLEEAIPELVQPDSWKSPDRPTAEGTIRYLSSSTDLEPAESSRRSGSDAQRPLERFPVRMSVLIVRQSRENHQQIEKIIQKTLHGDTPEQQSQGTGMGGMGGGMGGMGGGSFGGGFFSVPDK